MRFSLALVFTLVSHTVHAAGVGGVIGGSAPFPPGNSVWASPNANSVLAGNALTNLARRVTAGKTLVVPPGDYWIKTNLQSLLPPSVDLHVWGGARIIVGTSTDNATDRAIIDDQFDSLGGRTHRITGDGEFIISNQLGRVLLIADGASDIKFNCRIAWTLGAVGCIEQTAGSLVYEAKEFTRSEQYDALLCSGTKSHLTSLAVFAGDSIVELGNYANWGDCVVKIGYGEALASGGANGNGAISIGNNVLIDGGIFNFKRSSASISGALTNVATGNATIQNALIMSLPAATFSTVQRASSTISTSVKLVNCTLIGPTAVDPIEACPTGSNITVEDSTIICGASSTNWARPSSVGNCNVRLYGRLTTNRTNHSGITVIGHAYTTNASSVVTN